MQHEDAQAMVVCIRAALDDAQSIAHRVGAMPPGLETVLIIAHLGAMVDEKGAMDMGEFLHAMAHDDRRTEGGNGHHGPVRAVPDDGAGDSPSDGTGDPDAG